MGLLKKYKINLYSTKDKQIVSSDSKGDPKNYKLQIKVDYKVLLNKKNIYENTAIKQATYNNITDKYELSQYENNITEILSEIPPDIFSLYILDPSLQSIDK